MSGIVKRFLVVKAQSIFAGYEIKLHEVVESLSVVTDQRLGTKGSLGREG
jgi:hypothetical protein